MPKPLPVNLAHPLPQSKSQPRASVVPSWTKRTLQITLVCFAAVTMLGAGSPSTRFDRLGHKLMCTCGCAEILLECNHMGCPDSPGLISDLQAQLASNATDKSVFGWFAAKYGPIVLASPMRGGFDLVAWIVPFAVLFLGIGGVVLLVRLWHQRHAQATLAHPAGLPGFPAANDLRDRIRRETTFEP